MFSLDTVAGDMSIGRSDCSHGDGDGGDGGSFINQNTKQMEMDFVKNREFMGSDFFHQIPGLARYRSAPSSFLAALLDSPADNSSSGDETEALFTAIWNRTRDLNQKVSDDSQFHLKHETRDESEIRPGLNGFSNGLTSYETPAGGGGSYSVGLESQVDVRLNGSNLVRQSSSPAGFFNGFCVGSNHMRFSHGGSSSPRIMPSISENGNIHVSETEFSRNGSIRELETSPYTHETWTESNISDLKRNHEGNLKMLSTFNELPNQHGETSSLVHHLSLPKTSNNKGEPEKFKFLQFQPDVVPCQIRAKRGCATHPRSIAERVRRTRISEKMKKLQQLFPNLDKQTSTADMLDSAVEYIKDLQKQVQMLSERKANCICSSEMTDRK